MSAVAARSGRRPAPPAPGAALLDLVRERIERALPARSRYKYVHPRVLAKGRGWQVVSPNCSRNIRADGGEIAIAWLQPAPAGRWHLHARDHAAGRWVKKAAGLTLAEALARLCEDAQREFWQ